MSYRRVLPLYSSWMLCNNNNKNNNDNIEGDESDEDDDPDDNDDDGYGNDQSKGDNSKHGCE